MFLLWFLPTLLGWTTVAFTPMLTLWEKPSNILVFLWTFRILKIKVSRNPRSSDPHLENLHFKGKCTRSPRSLPWRWNTTTGTQMPVLIPERPHQPAGVALIVWRSFRCGCPTSILRIPSTASLGALWNHQESLKTYPAPMSTPGVVASWTGLGCGLALGFSQLPREVSGVWEPLFYPSIPFPLEPWFPNFASVTPSVLTQVPVPDSSDSDSSGLGWNPRIHIFIKVPGEADTVTSQGTYTLQNHCFRLNRRQSCYMGLLELRVSAGGVSQYSQLLFIPFEPWLYVYFGKYHLKHSALINKALWPLITKMHIKLLSVQHQ